MAQVRLNRREVKQGVLPPVCMRCGADANAEIARKFTWHPPWVYLLLFVGLLPAAIVAMVLTKKMVVHAPMCKAHKGHWLKRTLFISLTLILVIVAGVGGFIVLSVLAPGPQQANNKEAQAVFGFVCLGSTLLFVIWLVIVIVVQSTAIRPKQITDKTITLVGVSPHFIDALKEDADQWESRTRRPQVDEDDDRYFDSDARRPRRQPPDDDFANDHP